jgi:hypothetical protein
MRRRGGFAARDYKRRKTMPDLPGRGKWQLSNPWFGADAPFGILEIDFDNLNGTARYFFTTTPLQNLRVSGPGRFTARYILGVNHGWMEGVYHNDQTITLLFTGTVETTCTAHPLDVYMPRVLEDALKGVETTALNFATRFINDSKVRLKYLKGVKRYSDELLKAVNSGELTPEAAATQANAFRNSMMESSRLASSDVGRAVAEQIKAKGKTLPELLEYYAGKKFGKSFSSLAKGDQDAVYLAIVESGGRANAGVSASAARWGKLGRGMLVITLAISIYNISTSDNIWRTTAREGAGLAGGLAVGAGAGAAAGWVTGPGYPVTVGVSAFVGGVLGALGMDYVFDEIWPDD